MRDVADGVRARSATTATGTRLSILVDVNDGTRATGVVVRNLDEREVRELRDVCDAFLAGEPVR